MGLINRAIPILDGAYEIGDLEAFEMMNRLVKEEGLFVGSSSGVNCAAARKLAVDLGPGNTIVTILCDSGSRFFLFVKY